MTAPTAANQPLRGIFGQHAPPAERLQRLLQSACQTYAAQVDARLRVLELSRSVADKVYHAERRALLEPLIAAADESMARAVDSLTDLLAELAGGTLDLPLLWYTGGAPLPQADGDAGV